MQKCRDPWNDVLFSLNFFNVTVDQGHLMNDNNNIIIIIIQFKDTG